MGFSDMADMQADGNIYECLLCNQRAISGSHLCVKCKDETDSAEKIDDDRHFIYCEWEFPGCAEGHTTDGFILKSRGMCGACYIHVTSKR